MSTVNKIRLDLNQPIPLELHADPMASAIVLSLFCDRRATDEFGHTRGGWWGDALAEQSGDQWGCVRWVNNRAINTDFYLRREEDADRAALQWLIDDGVCHSIEVRAFDAGHEVMGIRIALDGVNYEIEVA